MPTAEPLRGQSLWKSSWLIRMTTDPSFKKAPTLATSWKDRLQVCWVGLSSVSGLGKWHTLSFGDSRDCLIPTSTWCWYALSQTCYCPGEKQELERCSSEHDWGVASYEKISPGLWRWSFKDDWQLSLQCAVHVGHYANHAPCGGPRLNELHGTAELWRKVRSPLPAPLFFFFITAC